MRVILFGATGAVGRRIANEAIERGHEVTGVVRSANRSIDLPIGVSPLILDIDNTESVANAMIGHDVAISALRPPEGLEHQLSILTKSVLDGARDSKTRVLIVGGAANLLMPDDSGYTVLTAPNFLPDTVKPIAAASFAQYQTCVAENDVNWAYFSPAAMLEPGERKGKFRIGSDVLLLDKNGNSTISIEDFAVSIVNEAETPTENIRRFTAAY